MDHGGQIRSSFNNYGFTNFQGTGVSALAGFQILENLSVGYSYGIPSNEISNGLSIPTHEIFLRLDIFSKAEAFLFSPRFFNYEKKVSFFLVFNFCNLIGFLSNIKDFKTDSLNYVWGDYYFLNSMYEKSILKYKTTEDNLSIDRLRNLANSYVLTNNLKEALDIYEKITKSNNANVLDYYNYANLLPAESKFS